MITLFIIISIAAIALCLFFVANRLANMYTLANFCAVIGAILLAVVIIVVTAHFVEHYQNAFDNRIAAIAAIGSLRVSSFDMLVNFITWSKQNHYVSAIENGISNTFYKADETGLYPVSSPYCKKLDAQSVINYYAGESKKARVNGIGRDATLTLAEKAADNAAKLAAMDLQSFKNACERNSNINKRETRFNPIVDNASKRSKSKHSNARIGYRDWLAIKAYSDETKPRKPHNNGIDVSPEKQRELKKQASAIAARRREQLSLAETPKAKALSTVDSALSTVDKLESILEIMENFELTDSEPPLEIREQYIKLFDQYLIERKQR